MTDILAPIPPTSDAPASDSPVTTPDPTVGNSFVVPPVVETAKPANKRERRLAAKAAKAAAKPAPLAKLPKLPRVRKPRPPQSCECGCGHLTRGGRFVPGHDARLHGWVLRVERGVCKLADLPEGERKAVSRVIAAKRKSA